MMNDEYLWVRRAILELSCLLLLIGTTKDANAEEPSLILTSPIDYQVIQRSGRELGQVPIRGMITNPELSRARWMYRFGNAIDIDTKTWETLKADWQDLTFQATIDVPSGGWYRLQLRSQVDDRVLAESIVEHFGVGEVFVVAGQSNSANHGEVKQTTQTGQVSTFDGTHWQLANDPQPGASGDGGSFMPGFGDKIANKLNVPVGIVACGIGATSVREWLPRGTRFPNPPTLEGNVQRHPNGDWESKGDLFERFCERTKGLGKHGFRAVLWHQGESDANQSDSSRTLAGSLYQKYLEQLIRDSRREIGWEAPWFVAQASYHVPGDESSPEIREAQAALWVNKIALQGPDTDQLKGAMRDNQGQGVHFSDAGLKAHAKAWAELVLPWLEEVSVAVE